MWSAQKCIPVHRLEIAVLYRRVQRPEQTGFLGRMKGLASAIWKRGTRRSPPAPKTKILRPPISLQIYRDIPLPTWSVVLPEKVLQFRPLDFLRTDLFAAAGLVAALAQARYESFYLDVVTAVSASIFLIRIFLGFRRQVDRYRVRLAEILREKTVACDATAIQYMAASAADQQFAQAALCYVLLLQHQNDTAHQDCTAHQRQDNTQQRQDGAAYQCQDDIHQHQDSKAYQKDTACQRQEDIAHQDSTAPPRHGDFQQHQDSTAHQKDAVREHHYNIHWHQHSTAHREDTAQGSKSRQGCTGIGLEVLASRAEQLLADHAGLRVCVNVDQAMSELLQRGLARRVPPMSPSNGELPLDDGQSHAGEDAQHSFHETGGKLGQEGRGTQHSVPKIEGGSHQRKTEGQFFQAVDPCVAQQVLEQQWDSILWQRVHSTLGRVEALSGSEPLGRS
ncbi:hypothetical protein DUNSADRAFT_3102 [Dunaliella salina]|uniref:Uncharacterized protein n=1 Tax=Dunaliella salina TaxID=3046 RepID=A0ABZ3KB90_DUNSA|nr:hypothetical protein DUNSADRAFT_3102 [Dunaliella salina]|eukprot:KAF5826438.1 hypothetical protein DUNSADRAFT_3102 [Dunaliella salina]